MKLFEITDSQEESTVLRVQRLLTQIVKNDQPTAIKMCLAMAQKTGVIEYHSEGDLTVDYMRGLTFTHQVSRPHGEFTLEFKMSSDNWWSSPINRGIKSGSKVLRSAVYKGTFDEFPKEVLVDNAKLVAWIVKTGRSTIDHSGDVWVEL